MRKAEGIGAIAGSILGAVATGIAIYYTHSPFSAMLGVIGCWIGLQIGKAIDHNQASR